MIFKTAIYLVSAFISIECAFAVLLLNKASKLNIIYFLLALDFAVSSIALCHISSVPDAGLCYLWYYINIPFGCALSTLSLHFTLVLTENRTAKSSLSIMPFYAASIIFAAMMLTGDYFFTVFVMTKWGWEPVLLITSAGTYLFIIFFSIPAVLNLIIFFCWRSNIKNGSQIELANKILIPYIAGSCGILLCPYFWHFKGYDTLNMILDISGQVLFFSFIFTLRIYLKKYKLTEISLETSACELITGIHEPVFLVMTGGEIISYNKSGAELIDIAELKKQSSIYDIFDCPVTLKNIIDNMYSGHIRRSEVRCSISVGRDGKRSFNLNIQSIYGQSGELSGVLVFLKEDPVIGEFKKCYSITDRQLDIIMMVVSGMSNRQIAEKFVITEKTVENHLFNIYNKIGIESKIQLFYVMQKYNIIPN